MQGEAHIHPQPSLHGLLLCRFFLMRFLRFQHPAYWGGLLFRSLAGASAFHTWPASHQTIQKDRFICDSTFPPTGDDSMIPPLFARTHHLLMCQLKGQCRRPLCSSAHVSLPYCNIYRRLISAPDLCICPSGTSVTPFIAVLYTLPTLGPSPM